MKKKIFTLILMIIALFSVYTISVQAEFTGTLYRFVVNYEMLGEMEYWIMKFDSPRPVKIVPMYGGEETIPNVDEIQIHLNNSTDDMDGKRARITSYDYIMQGHTRYHIRDYVMLDATAELIDDNINVMLDGRKLTFEQNPIIVNDRTLVPLRAIFEGLGAVVDWDGTTKTVTATRDGIVVKMTIGENKMYKNNLPTNMDVAPQLVNNFTLVPARAVAEAFNCNVDWDDATKTVIIEK